MNFADAGAIFGCGFAPFTGACSTTSGHALDSIRRTPPVRQRGGTRLIAHVPTGVISAAAFPSMDARETVLVDVGNASCAVADYGSAGVSVSRYC